MIAKWNYTEDVAVVAILATIKDCPVGDHSVDASKRSILSWLRPLVGTQRQILQITDQVTGYRFYIDNEHGEGLRKIKRGGGPDSGSHHLGQDDFEIVRFLPDSEINPWNMVEHYAFQQRNDDWLARKEPEAWARLEGLRQSFLTNNFGLPKKDNHGKN